MSDSLILEINKAYTQNLMLLVARGSPYTALVIDKKTSFALVKTYVSRYTTFIRNVYFKKTIAAYRSGHLVAVRVALKMPMKRTSQMPIADFDW